MPNYLGKVRQTWGRCFRPGQRASGLQIGRGEVECGNGIDNVIFEGKGRGPREACEGITCSILILPEAAFLLNIVENSSLIISLPASRAAIEWVKSAHHIVVGGTMKGISADDFYGRFSKVIVFLQ